MKLPIDRLEALVEEKRAASGAPGIAVGIVTGGELAWFLGAGFADLDRGTSPTVHSLARVASVTKTFTATAVLQLRDRGLLSLDDPLELHLPEFGAVLERGGRRRDVTVRTILTHRSGLVTESPPTAWDRPGFPAMSEILAALPETAVVVPLNSIWKYSNLGFALLGEVVARLSGRPYADYVQAQIFDPLGLAETAFEPDERLRPLLMTGYQPAEHQDRPELAPVASLAGLTAAGQLHSNVNDLARWVTFHLGAGTGPETAGAASVLASATRAEAQQTLWAQPDFLLGQGLAWRMVRVGEHVFHNHGGSVHGFSSSVGFHVPTGIGVIVLANLWPASVAGDLAMELLEAVVGSAAGTSPRGAAVTGPPEPAPEHVRPYLGRYRARPGIVLNVDWRGGSLRFITPPGGYGLHAPSALEPVVAAAVTGADAAVPGRTTDTYRVADGRGAGEEFKFMPGPDGRAASFALGGFVYRRAD